MNKKDSSKKCGSAGILLALILSIGSIYPLTVYAQESKGSFIEYSFNYSSVKSDVNREGSGSLRLEVLENFGNATLRIETSGSLNNAEFQIKNNIAEERFVLPFLSTLPQLDQTIIRENGTVSIRTERLVDETVTIHETSWVLNVSRITVEAEGIRNGENVVINIQGDLKILAISGLLYSFTGNIQEELSGAHAEVSITFVDSNLNIENKPESSMSIFSQINTLASFGMRMTPLSDQELSTQSNSITSSYLLIGSIAGAIGLITFVVLMNKRKVGRNITDEEKPLHWVH